MDVGAGRRITAVSGYRPHQEQVKIWEDTMRKEGEKFTRTYVAKPGHSEHESGLAVDLAEQREEIDFIRPEFPRSGICRRFRIPFVIPFTKKQLPERRKNRCPQKTSKRKSIKSLYFIPTTRLRHFYPKKKRKNKCSYSFQECIDSVTFVQN